MNSIPRNAESGYSRGERSAIRQVDADLRADEMHEARAILASQKGDRKATVPQPAPVTSPFNFGDHAVRVVVREGQPWFVAADVCAALDYKNASKAVADHLDPDERSNEQLDRSRMGSKAVIINESGLYALVLRSRKPEARKFAKWVTSEVLPQIRRTGVYLPKEFAVNPGDVLTKEQQDVLRQLVKSTVDRLPKPQQGGAAVKMWSKLKAHFGVAYRDIPQHEFTEAVSLLTRAATEWEVVEEEVIPTVDPEKLLLAGLAEPVPLPDDILRAVDRRTWELTQEAHGLIHMHLQKRVAHFAVGGHPEKHLDRGLAMEALNRGKLGDALAHAVIEKSRQALSYASWGATAMLELQASLEKGIAWIEAGGENQGRAPT